MSRNGNKNANRSSGWAQALSLQRTLYKKVRRDSYVNQASARVRAGCLLTADARKLAERADKEGKRMSVYAKTQGGKANREQGKKGPSSVATSQMPLRALKATGEYAAEHGRGMLKKTSTNHLQVNTLRAALKVVVTELEHGLKALPKKVQKPSKRIREDHEIEEEIVLS